MRAILWKALATAALCVSAVQVRADNFSQFERQPRGGLTALDRAFSEGADTTAAISGTCAAFQVGAVHYPCKGILFVHYARGRSGYVLPTKNGGSILVSGGRDSQLTPERYMLSVDRITVIPETGAAATTYVADGTCRAEISTSGEVWKTVVCEASNGMETVRLRFEGDGSTWQVKHL